MLCFGSVIIFFESGFGLMMRKPPPVRSGREFFPTDGLTPQLHGGLLLLGSVRRVFQIYDAFLQSFPGVRFNFMNMLNQQKISLGDSGVSANYSRVTSG